MELKTIRNVRQMMKLWNDVLVPNYESIQKQISDLKKSNAAIKKELAALKKGK